jgi:hypothetical protein
VLVLTYKALLPIRQVVIFRTTKGPIRRPINRLYYKSSLINKSNYVYNIILIVINKFIKIALYILIIKKVILKILAKLYINYIISKYKVLKLIISNREL